MIGARISRPECFNTGMFCDSFHDCFTMFQSHLSHVKACAKMYGVSAVLLKERLDQQREEYIIKLAAGVLPSDPRWVIQRW